MKLLTVIGGYSGEWANLKYYTIANGTQSHFAADTSVTTGNPNFCTDGTNTNVCQVPGQNGSYNYARASLDTFSVPNRWAMLKPNTNAIRGMQFSVIR